MARLESLQVARGIAASLVFVMHLMNMAAMYSGWDYYISTLAGWSQYVGHFGVDIFFVLSGFVIAVSASRAKASPGRNAVNFLIKRAARIYPLFWMTLLMSLLLPAIPGSDNSLDALAAKPESIFLLSPPAAHPLAWTLVYEVQFYILASIFMLFGARTRALFLTWAVSQVVVVIAAKLGYLPRLPITDGLTLEFCFGVFIGLLMPNNIVKYPVTLILVSFVLVICSSSYFGTTAVATNTLIRALLWGIPAGLIIMSLVTIEARGARFKKPLLDLGDESYSLYMWHLIILIASNQALHPILPERGPTFAIAYVILATVLTLAISRMSYRLVERPVLRKVAGLELRPRQFAVPVEL